MSFLIVFLLVSMFLIFIKSQISNIVISKVCNYSLITSVLDTNVYNNSNVLSCKIDKTPPTVTCSYNSSTDYWHFSDALSGCDSYTLTGISWPSYGSKYIYVDGTQYTTSGQPNKTKLNTKTVTADNGNFRIKGYGTSSYSGSQYSYATLTIYDAAGNSKSKQAGVYYGGSNNTGWYHAY